MQLELVLFGMPHSSGCQSKFSVSHAFTADIDPHFELLRLPDTLDLHLRFFADDFNITNRGGIGADFILVGITPLEKALDVL